ncbi:histidine phosphatase family protein [Parvularcula marina]|uniref:Histidine phosphatase family protein n=1 Tax=Parvularcula marina TaxID=2292771 RepID=A0A371RFF5_9PROT|nr:histidine phosphatase family protein [Parvularcula marina]RFB04176.1 histidine phosphatase family protein [Parvularcula marina]
MLSLFGKGRAKDEGMPGGRIDLPFPVWFSRHGQTDWNKAGRFQGHSDIPLNETGRQQAARNGRALRERIKNLDELVFVTSPLVRAAETLEIIRDKLGLPRRRYGVDDRLIEIDLGDWNGKTVDEINAEDPGVWERRQKDKWAYKVPGGESYADAAARTREFLLELKGPALIVGHGASGRILRGYLCGLDRQGLTHLKSPQDLVFELKGGKEKTV